MRDLHVIYDELDASLEQALETFGEESLVEVFIRKFMEEPSFGKLEDTLNRGELTEAFRLVHSMKSLTSSLGLTGLYNAVCNLTEILRPGHERLRVPADIEVARAQLREEYERVMEAFQA